MARPYYSYSGGTRDRQALIEKIRNKVSELVHRVWADDLICITLFKSLFFYLGMWPVEDHPSRRGYWFRYWNPRLALATTSFVLAVSIPIVTYQARNDELIAFLEPIVVSFPVGIFSLQLVCFTKYSGDFKMALRSLQKARDCGALLPLHPKAVVNRSRKLTMLVLLFFGLCIWNVLLFGVVMVPMLFVKRKLPTKFWYPYDVNASPYYEITLLGMASSIVSGGTVFALVIAFFLAFLVQAIGQLQLLNHNILKIHQSQSLRTTSDPKHFPKTRFNFKAKPKKDDRQNEMCRHYTTSKAADYLRRIEKRNVVKWRETDFEMTMALRSCVKHHQSIVSFVRQVESVYRPLMVAQYIVSVVPTFIAIILITHSELDMRIMMFLTLIAMCNLSLAIFSRLANEITIQSAQVKDAVFGCDWFAASNSFKRSMRIMILMSNQPLVIKVAGKLHLSMESFLAVTKLTYSYYMTAVATVRRQHITEKISMLAMPDML